MTTALDFVNDANGFAMPGATRFRRLRARHVPNPYNPNETGDDWTKPDTLEFTGALASSSSTRMTDGLREQTDSNAVLTIADPNIDIRVGDRIETLPDDGRRWTVTGFPSHDANAFTGYRPTTEINLRETRG